MNERVCAYCPCSESLEGMDRRALFCSRRHKEEAAKVRRRRAGRLWHEICDVCREPYLGKPPYCPKHEPEGTR